MYHRELHPALFELAACAGSHDLAIRADLSIVLLIFLAFGTHDFVGVTNTLCLIRLRTTVGAQIRCNRQSAVYQRLSARSQSELTFCSDTGRQRMLNR